MVNKSDLKIGEEIYAVSPSCGIFDGMLTSKMVVKEITNNMVNGVPFKYCFLNKDEAKEFERSEDKKAYRAFDEYFACVNACKDTSC